MGTVHQLIRDHGKDVARLYLNPEERPLLDAAAEVLGTEIPEFGWAYTGWAFTALPHKQIPLRFDGRPQSWQRQVGPVMLTVNPGWLPGQRKGEQIEKGVPFGAHARLVLLYLQTAALKTGSREIEVGRNLNDFLERIGLSDGGKTRQSVWEQLLRIAACETVFTWDSDPDSPPPFMKGNIIKGGQLGLRMTDERQAGFWQDRVVLDADFCEALRKSAIPVMEQAIKAIGASSLALDLYVWLAYRLRSLEGPKALPWQALHAQFGAEYARVRDFKRKVRQPLGLALAVYPEAQVSIDEDGLILYPSRPPIVAAR